MSLRVGPRRRPGRPLLRSPGLPPLPAAEPPPVPAAAAPAVPEKAYTGRSAGDEVTVAVAVKDGKAVAYVCDGEKVEACWRARSPARRWRCPGRPAPSPAPWTTRPRSARSWSTGRSGRSRRRAWQAPAGLYEGRGLLRGVAARVGWIVEDDGTVTGVLTAGGESSRAPVLDLDAPEATTLDGRPVAVTAIAGDATVVRR